MTAKTIRSGRLGKIDLRLVDMNGVLHGVADEGAKRIAHIQGESAESADQVWTRLQDEVAKRSVGYFGYDGARSRFLKYFPGGFSSDAYLGTSDGKGAGERAYKMRAKALLDELAPLEAAATGTGYGAAVRRVFQATNMLSPFEKPRIGDVLKGPNADAFVRGAARFALGDVEAGLAEMEKAAKADGAAKWIVATYLPFLWRPDVHVFLKPEVTKDYAERVGHRYGDVYEPALRPEIYESLRDLYAKTGAAIADLSPRDNIDLQSFIWVVGEYTDENQPA
ncbi:MAG TPA: hypothetical protein VMU59_11105 [Caulobacteraceae bacterium]|nr:hypothetical protein [Caulobacteraceae bacterium]